MAWNWEQADWGRFTWRGELLAAAERKFLLGSGTFQGMVEHLAEEERDHLFVEAMSTEAVTTSKIEGEVLSRESVQSSIQRGLGLGGDARRVPAAERGIAEVMVDLYRGAAGPLTEQDLLRWHGMMMAGRTELMDIGRWRTSPEPMQVVSGAMGKEKVHFEAPSAERVPAEVRRFIEWFRGSGPGSASALPALTRAGVAHLYFESIHPFEDGNGRIGRAIIEKSLAQSIGRPVLTAMAATILAHRREYYDALEAANKGNEVTRWLAWFAGIALEAQDRTLAQVEFIVNKTRLLDRFKVQLNPRQLGVLLRVMREGPEGFTGGLSAGKYVAISKTATATASRDLAEMVDLGVLTRTGAKKGTRYHLPFETRAIRRVRITDAGEVVRE